MPKAKYNKEDNDSKSNIIPQTALNNKYIYLICIIILGFIIRILPMFGQHGRLIFLTNDAYYHLWQTANFLKSFPAIIILDPYLNFPNGGYCIWPFLYDYLIAAGMKIFGIQPLTRIFEFGCFIYPALYGTFMVFIIYLIGKELKNIQTGLISAVIYSLLPAAVNWGRAGYFDHDIAYVFFSSAAFLFFLKSHKSLRHAVMAGIFLTCSLYSWQGSVLYGLLFFILALIHGYWMKNMESLFNSAVVFILPFVCIIPYSIILGSKIGTYFSPYHLSFPYAFSFVIAGFSLLFLSFVKRKKIDIFGVFSMLVLITSVVIFIYGIKDIGNFFNAFFLKKDAWFKNINEFQPLYLINGGLNFSYVEILCGWGFFAIPIILYIFLKYEKMNFALISFLILTIMTFSLTSLQSRFVPAFSVPFALLLAYFTWFIWHRITKYKVITVALWIIFIGHQLVFFDYLPEKDAQSLELYDWMASQVQNHKEEPLFGILTEWDMGHRVRYYSGIPPLADNFGTQSSHLREASLAFCSTDEEKFTSILRKNKIRYVWTTFAPLNMEIYQDLVGAQKYVYTTRAELKKRLFLSVERFDRYKYSIDYLNLINQRLYFFDGGSYGADTSGTEFLSRFRLVHESRSTTKLFNRILSIDKVFEYVPGVVVIIHGRQNLEVNIGLEVNTNTGRSFLYKRFVVLNKNGRGTMILPYATIGSHALVVTSKNYTVKADGKSYEFSVTEQNIKSADTLYWSL